MATCGWIVNVDRCSYLEDKGDPSIQVYNVNLVRPWSDQERYAPPPADFLRLPALAKADDQLGTLLYPWMWDEEATKVTWKAYAFLPNGDTTDATPRWVPIPVKKVRAGTVDIDHNAAVATLKSEMRREVGLQTAGCGFPFSRDIADYWGRANQTDPVTMRSHVHALAPMTHWPTVASGPLLGLSRFVEIDAADVAGATHVACFPDFMFTRAGNQIAAGSKSVANPTTSMIREKREAYAVYDPADIGFFGLSAEIAKPLPAPLEVKLAPSQGFVSKSALQSLVVGHLLHLELLSAWVSTLVRSILADSDQVDNAASSTNAEVREALALLSQPAVYAGLRQALWQAPGTGQERSPISSGNPPNVVEWFLPYDSPQLASVARKMLNAGPINPAEADFAKVVASLSNRAQSPTWTATSVKRWSTFAELFPLAAPAGTPSRIVDGWRGWLTLASTVASAEGARELLGPWLALLDEPIFNADASLAVAWPNVHKLLLDGESLRQDHVSRTRVARVTDGQWAMIAPSPYEPGVEIKDTPQLVVASLDAVHAVIGDAAYNAIDQAPLGTLSMSRSIAARVDELVQSLGKAGAQSRPRPRDRGITLDFSSDEPVSDAVALAEWDNRIRGYAIALCGGTVKSAVVADDETWLPDTLRAQWITDTALAIKVMNGQKPVTWLDDATHQTAWMHDTVGSTLSDGERTISVEYDGIPIATALADLDKGVKFDPTDSLVVVDGFKILDFGWPTQARKLPLMAYGGFYAAVATAIDNAGGVIDSALRGANLAILKEAKELDDFKVRKAASLFQYMSSEPAAPPRVVDPPTAIYELSDETQAHAFQHAQAQSLTGLTGTPKKVALLGCDPAGTDATNRVFADTVHASCTLTLSPPQTHPEFFRRWVNGDLLIVATKSKSPLSDGNFSKLNYDQLSAFAASTAAVKPAPYHPAVTAIGIEVMDPLGKTQVLRIATLQRTEFDANNTLAPIPFSFACTVKSIPAVSATPAIVVGNVVSVDSRQSTIEIQVPQGSFVRIRSYALVANDHFDAAKGTTRRYASGIALENADDPGFGGYKCFAPTEHWFEVIPPWTDLKQDDVSLTFAAPYSADGLDVSPNLGTVSAAFGSTSWVRWTRGLLIQRHEWHWTGYPVKLPRGDDVAHWLASLAGVESFREVIDATFTTSFGANDQWSIGPDASNADMVYRWTLPSGARPARYAAFFARPVLRFRRWLNPANTSGGPLTLERHIYGSGAVVPGRRPASINERIAAPPLRWSVPLTAAFKGAVERSDAVTRPANGALLVFDEAIRRTGEISRIGGIGDTLEIDLVDTRFPAFPELGLNPMMHPVDAIDRSNLAVRGGRPFGLTFDIGPNPLVAQTAIIVTPEHAGGRWTMAKLRARRLILPETEMGSALSSVLLAQATESLAQAMVALEPAARNELETMSKRAFGFPLRAQGDDSVPMDSAIDLSEFEPKNPPRVRLLLASGKAARKLDIAVPTRMTAKAGARRLLLSWHKDRWHQSDEPSWRCQVLLQYREDQELAWQTEDKASCYVNAGSQLPARLVSAGCWMFVNDSAAKSIGLRTVRMSDYTDPLWMTFIGSFDSESIGNGDDYMLAPAGSNATLILRGRRPDMAVPQLHPLAPLTDESRFHLALVFRPLPDVSRSEPDPGTGALVAVYGVGADEKSLTWLCRYDAEYSDSKVVAPVDLSGCYGYVIALQRVTALSTGEAAMLAPYDKNSNKSGFKSFEGLLNLAFPDQGQRFATESLMRFLPEYLGPIAVGASP